MRFHQGRYQPKNPDKYIGTYPIHFRSSWEAKVMAMFDSNPNIIAWASESIRIPYTNPFTGRKTVYIPDFLVQYQDKNGITHTEIVEVKPLKESQLSEAKSKSAKAALALNAYKWAAAQAFANNNGMKFRVMNETDIFRNPIKSRTK